MFEGRALAGEDLAECRMAGELDAAAAPDARSVLAQVRPRAAVVLDLDGVRFVDSAGLGVLVTAIRHLHAQGCTVALSVAPANVRRVLQLVGLDRLVPLASSAAEAKRLIAASGDGDHSTKTDSRLDHPAGNMAPIA